MSSSVVLVFQCSACEADTTVCCKQCGKPVCSLHRWGTGELSDGYVCTGDCVFSELGDLSVVQRRPPLEKGENYLVTLALIGIVAVLTFLTIYVIAQRPELGMWIGR